MIMKKIQETYLWLALIVLSLALILFYYFSNPGLEFQEIIMTEKFLKNWLLFLSPIFIIILIKTSFHIKNYMEDDQLAEDLHTGLIWGAIIVLLLSIISILILFYALEMELAKSILMGVSISYIIGFLIKTIISFEISSVMHSALSPAIILGGTLAFVDLEDGIIVFFLVLFFNSFFIIIKKIKNRNREKIDYYKPRGI